MKSILIAMAMFIAAPVVSAQVTIKEPWVRGTVAHQTATGAFMQLVASADSRLVAVQSPLAKHVEIHEMNMQDNVMKMRPVDVLPLPAGTVVELKPGGFHLMLTGLTAPLKEGDSIPLTLVFETGKRERQVVELAVPVRALQTPAGQHHGKH